MRVKSEAESSPTSLQIPIFLSVSQKEESRLAACDVLAATDAAEVQRFRAEDPDGGGSDAG